MIFQRCNRFVLECISVLAVLTAAGHASAQQGLVAAGVGSAGNWETEVELANPFDQPMTVLLSEFPANDFKTGCDFGCGIEAVDGATRDAVSDRAGENVARSRRLDAYRAASSFL